MIMYTLYIGSNNITGVLEKEKAITIISQYFNGFSYYEIDGYWLGKRENTLKVEIITNDNEMIILLCNTLKTRLEQDSILETYINIISNFI